VTPFPLQALRSVDFEVPDLAAAAEFYAAAWALEAVERDGARVWLRGTGDDPHLLALHAAPRAAIRSMTFRAAPDTDLDAVGAAMVANGATTVHGARALDEHGGGVAIAARDAVGRTIRVVQGDALATPRPFDIDRPAQLAHVNINSDDVVRDVAFFERALGFRLTDRSKMMAFVRTNADHHSVVIADATVNTLNHVAFLMPSWEGVMKASGRLVDHGVPIGWGPGRHGPGDNVFAYFVDPFGFVIEYTAEVLQVDDGYRVGGPDDWIWPPGRTDQWGIAPPKTPECKAAQLAIPFA